MGLIWIAGAALWGVGEATLFFIVPDVLLTAAVMRFGLQRALRLAVIAAAFASLAGLGMWLWARNDAASARHVMLLIPAIEPDLLTRTHRELAWNWPVHLFIGAITGVPYKLYAVEAGARAINPFLFTGVSFAARLARFSLTATIAALGREAFLRLRRPRWIYPAWAVAWIMVYAVYFTLRGLI